MAELSLAGGLNFVLLIFNEDIFKYSNIFAPHPL